MKFVFPLCFLFFLSCNAGSKEPEKTKAQIAQDSARAYLQKVLHNPHSYEPVSFGPLDSVFRTAYEDKSPRIYRIQDSLSEIADSYYILSANHEKYFDLSLSYYDSLKALIADTTYRGKFLGFSMTHKLRATNAMNALMLHDYEFRFDSLLNITDMVDLDDRDEK